jgi:hypothetical protein
MPAQKYSVNQHPIQTLLTWIESKELAIPEIQRPFVWAATKLRGLRFWGLRIVLKDGFANTYSAAAGKAL